MKSLNLTLRAFGLLLGVVLGPAAFANLPGGGSAGSDVTLTDKGGTVVLANGILTATVNKSPATVTSLKYKGFETVSSGHIYFSMDGGTSYQNPSNCVYSVKTSTADMVDVSCKHTYASSDPHIFDIDIHYVLRRGASGLYVYAVLSHPASYAATSVCEWRMVWQLPTDPKNSNNFLFENIYVDALRHGPAPSYLEFAQATVTGIKEISLLNTGPQAGTYFSKYEFSADYREIGTWGHASDVNKIGCWMVIGSDEYLNDGPTKQDLILAQGYSLIHFGRNHYGGSGTSVAAGEDWSKTYGPYLCYLDSAPPGAAHPAEACWADAKAQVAAEQAAWPYAWLTTAADYPSAAQRGAVSGSFLVNDLLRPSQTGAGAWVGVSQPDAGGNWQNESKRYQYWAKAGADGGFTIPNVRPGTYTFSAFVNGETDEYTGTATVKAGQTTQMGHIVWNIAHPGKSIAWEIGTPDRTAAEFYHGSTDYFRGYLYLDFYKEFPNPLDFTIGVSNPATDWNYAQSAEVQADGTTTKSWPWRIHFTLPAKLPATGNATLTLAYAGSDHAHMYLYVNNDAKLFKDLGGPPNGGGNSLLRQGVHAKYGLQTASIPMANLKPGENVITLLQAASSYSGNHVMYDYLNLEMPYANPAVSGKVLLPNWLGAMPTLTFTLTPTNGTLGGVITQRLAPAPGGAFTLPNIPFGTYTLRVKGAQWLQKAAAVDVSGGSVSGLTLPLAAGDLNGDNAVSLPDLALLMSAYGTTPLAAKWNPLADLNGDGSVSLADLALLQSNYSKTGDP